MVALTRGSQPLHLSDDPQNRPGYSTWREDAQLLEDADHVHLYPDLVDPVTDPVVQLDSSPRHLPASRRDTLKRPEMRARPAPASDAQVVLEHQVIDIDVDIG